MTAPDDREDIATAVQCLGDELARELRACELVLKLESDIGLRRVAENRWTAIKSRMEKAA